MSAFVKTLSALLFLTLFASCGSTPKPFEDNWDLKYQHTAEFMWEEVQVALAKYFRIAEKDFDTRTITTDWNEHLSVMSHHGYRERLIVTLDGDEEKGFSVQVKEEKQINTEQVNPQASSEADWEDAEAEGGALSRFRVALHRRLHPKESWKNEGIR